MPPQLASFLTICFIVYLFRRDIKEKPNITNAVWIPVIWLLINGSRYVSEWMTMFGIPVPGGGSVEDGSPVDALIFFTLIVSGLRVLVQRQVDFSMLIQRNILLVVFLVYCFAAIGWADSPFIAFKRWIKILGHPIMVMVLLTEPDPDEALKRFMKRVSYILAPVSVLFIKYYPAWGRGFSPWTGEAYNTGITLNKNALGVDCAIMGFFFVWYLLQVRQQPKSKARRNELIFCAVFIYMVGWLLFMAHSSTSLVAVVVGLGMVFALGMPFVSKRYIGSLVIVALVGWVVAEEFFDVSTQIIIMLGKDPTLTDRTILWNDLLAMDIDPILGTGFESFWLGERVTYLWSKHTWRPNQAHNGYLETYLNLGIVGVTLLVVLLVATFRKCRLELLRQFEWGRYRMGFLIAVILYNWTEASFKAVHPMWTAFYLIALDYPRPRPKKAAAEVEDDIVVPLPEEKPIETRPRKAPASVWMGRSRGGPR